MIALIALVAAAGGAVWYFGMRQTPEDAVAAYLTAWDERDCEANEETTTESFRGEDYTCSSWRENIASWEADGYMFDSEIGEAAIDGDRARVRITETIGHEDGDQRQVYDFLLVKERGTWLIDGSETIEDATDI